MIFAVRPLTARRLHRGTATLAVLLLAVGIVGVSRAQAGPGEWWVGRPLTNALEELRSRGLNLIYSDNLVTSGMLVIDEPSSSDPRRILDELLRPYGLGVRDGPGGSLLIVANTDGLGRITGRLTIRGREKPPAAARIRVGNTETLSDTAGRFELEVPAGTYRLTVTSPGYLSKRIDGIRVEAARTTGLSIALDRLNTVHESVVVTTGKSASDSRASAGLVGLVRGDLDTAPQLVDDPYQVIARLPGAASSDLSGAVNIRGGRGDEVLLVIDGLEISDPFHVKDLQGGLFSIIDSTAISELSYYGGAFPVEYGNRLSGVIDVTTRTPSGPTSTSLTAGTTQLRAASGGSFADDRGHWFVSARRGDPGFVLESWFPESIYDPTYFDLLGKVTRTFGSRTTLSANVLLAFDENEIGEGNSAPNSLGDSTEFADTSYRNNYVWLTADTTLSSKVFARTVLSYGGVDRDRRVASGGSFVDDQRDYSFFGFEQNWNFVASGRHQLKWGYGIRVLDASYDYFSTTGMAEEGMATPRPLLPQRLIINRSSGNEYFVYVSDTIRVGESTLLEFGTRWDGETYTGVDDPVFSPRVNLVQMFGARTKLQAGFGFFHQAHRIYELQVEDGLDSFQKVQESEQAMLSVEHTFSPKLRIRLGAYQKNMEDLAPRFENQCDPASLIPEAEPDRIEVDPGRAQTSGLELTAQGDTAWKMSWSVGFVVSTAEDRIGGETVPRSWDQRRALDFSLGYRLKNRWQFGLTGTFHTGWPTTAVSAKSVTLPDGSTAIVPVLGPRNRDQLPSFRRIDLRAKRMIPLGRGRLDLFIDVANALDNDNFCCVESFDFNMQPDGEIEVVRHLRKGLDRAFAFGVNWEF